MNLRIKAKNHAADPEVGYPPKSNLRPYSRAAAMPTAWELRKKRTFCSSRSVKQQIKLRGVAVFGCKSLFYFLISNGPIGPIREHLELMYATQ